MSCACWKKLMPILFRALRNHHRLSIRQRKEPLSTIEWLTCYKGRNEQRSSRIPTINWLLWGCHMCFKNRKLFEKIFYLLICLFVCSAERSQGPAKTFFQEPPVHPSFHPDSTNHPDDTARRQAILEPRHCKNLKISFFLDWEDIDVHNIYFFITLINQQI